MGETVHIRYKLPNKLAINSIFKCKNEIISILEENRIIVIIWRVIVEKDFITMTSRTKVILENIARFVYLKLTHAHKKKLLNGEKYTLIYFGI